MAKRTPNKAKRPERGLTPRERLFAYEWVRDHNGTRAAIDAGYAESGAAVTASRLLRKPNVAALLSKLEEKLLAKVESKAEKVLAELHFVGLSRLARVIADDGSVKPLSEWPEAEQAALSKLKLREVVKRLPGTPGRVCDDGVVPPAEGAELLSRQVGVEFDGKLRALELLAKHHELIDADKLEVTGNITIVVADPYAAPSAAPPARRVDEMAG